MSYWIVLIFYTSCIFSFSYSFTYSELLTFSYNRHLKESLNSKSINGSSILHSLVKHGIILDNIKTYLYDHDFSNESIYSQGSSLLINQHHDDIILDSISPQCVQDAEFALIQLRNRQQWTYSMLDAYFKPPAGVMLGNLQWLGSEDQCIGIQVPRANRTTFSTHQCYVMISPGNASAVEFELTTVSLGLGLCVPSSCSSADVAYIIEQGLALSPTPLSLVHSSCSSDTEAYSGYAIFFFVFTAVLLLMTTACTMFDNLMYSRRSKVYVEINDASYEEIGEEREQSPLLPANQITPTKDSVLCSLLLAFSATRNLQRILTVSAGSTKEGDLSAVHGIRFLSMTWVILGHAYVFGVATFANPLIIIGEMKNITFLTIFNATVSVDTFFLLSGTLVSYHLLRELEKREYVLKVNWLYFYVHRYVRLTIPYMIVLYFWTTVFKYSINGPLSKSMMIGMKTNHWWRNPLYVQNFWAMADDAMGWCWYLANDMQFFIVSPLFVIALYKHKYIGLLLILLTMVGSWVITGTIASVNKFPLNMFAAAGKQTVDYMDKIYEKPYCRISPYLIGIALGYALFTTKLRYRINRSVNMVMWVVAFGLCTSVIYGNYDELNGAKVATGVDALYIAVARSVWALGVAWVVFSCANNSGGYVNTFLSWSGFVPFSRTTFFAYLLHPMILVFFYATRRHLITFDETFIAYIYPGLVLLSYGCALVCTVLIESPVIALEKILMKKLGKHKD